MDRLNWDDTRVFLALARAGSLSGAARGLGLGVATMARRIERMEQALGLPLFRRHQAGYALTDEGRALVPRAEAVELAMSDLRTETAAQSEICGLVRLACVESLITPVLLPALSPLMAENPGLDLEISFQSTTVNLHRHDADLALRMVRPERGNLRVRKLAEVGFGLYAPAGGAVPDRHVIWPEHPGLSTPAGWSAALCPEGAPRMAVNTMTGMVEAVRMGTGVGLLPHFLARAAGLRLLRDRLPSGERMQRELLLVTHGDLAAARRVRAVSEVLTAAIIARRADLEAP
ncbi:LysR family transcriptional regulator [Pseudooceanicola sp. CBS1P-1]|uniref:LysR family transcriptional regulator n=1 Tax=Pseudooceanicola albus TaxID=2692189 RepID=A0A6L7G5P1_9RHOB|nr:MULTISPECIES: LysR family transcriptional regulator [Pseudooceanicola]MBT9385343.1 LysR family transcriptional regulator [Pseudooceanicola endophyticus]MXN18798.1 LysR family transcriptional regulator [Pseudooceanicola albus]